MGKCAVQLIIKSDLTKRWDLMIQAEKVMMEDMAYIPVFEKGAAALKAKNVKGLVVVPVGTPYTFKYVKLK